MDSQWSEIAANGIIHAATMAFQAWEQNSYEFTRPCVLFKPVLSRDGNQWCALLGDNLQEGIAGFGNTPYLAMYAFDKAFNTETIVPLPTNDEDRSRG
jgi:hypothetical protein